MASEVPKQAFPSNIYLIPPPAYAEDLNRRQARSILTIHVLHRGFTTGAIVGTFGTSLYSLFRRRAAHVAPNLPPTVSAASIKRAAVFNAARNGAATGGLWGFGLMIPALYMRMRDQGEYGWQDRSYRLLHNAGQVASDWGSLVGAVVGFGFGEGLLIISRQKRVPLVVAMMGLKGWKDVIGFTGLGSTIGTLGVFGERLATGKMA